MSFQLKNISLSIQVDIKSYTKDWSLLTMITSMGYKSLEKLTSNIRGVKFYTYVHMAQEIDFYGNP